MGDNATGYASDTRPRTLAPAGLIAYLRAQKTLTSTSCCRVFRFATRVLLAVARYLRNKRPRQLLLLPWAYAVELKFGAALAARPKTMGWR